MIILAFDTSTSKGGVAVLDNQKILSQSEWTREASHSELLTPALQDALARAGKTARDLDVIAVGHGPGSFTGVRVAVNAARALAYALDKRVLAFDTGEILAAAVTRTDLPLAVVLNAHKNLLFVATYVQQGGAWVARAPMAVATVTELERLIATPHLVVGDGYATFAQTIGGDFAKRLVRDGDVSDAPSAEVLARLAIAQGQSRRLLVWNEVQALYIRASGAEEKLREEP